MAKENAKEKKTFSLSPKLLKEYRELCNSLGMTMSARIEILIQKDIKQLKRLSKRK